MKICYNMKHIKTYDMSNSISNEFYILITARYEQYAFPMNSSKDMIC